MLKKQGESKGPSESSSSVHAQGTQRERRRAFLGGEAEAWSRLAREICLVSISESLGALHLHWGSLEAEREAGEERGQLRVVGIVLGIVLARCAERVCVCVCGEASRRLPQGGG